MCVGGGGGQSPEHAGIDGVCVWGGGGGQSPEHAGIDGVCVWGGGGGGQSPEHAGIDGEKSLSQELEGGDS